ncbi:MAG: UDP-N-acetylmuramoyl-L-alanine--D-glutamate ligase [Planctomycetia bacterium]|nr:UDP-N-acetylmuramoyl-L-alanine--D-glutamate ligase [Planctomycetia bacterium]
MNRLENNINNMKNCPISVIGLGRSGVAIARLANYLGSKVYISDNSSSKSIKDNLNSLESIGVQGEMNGHTDKIYDSDLMVISPGVTADSLIILEAQKRGIKVIGEIEFASLFTNAPLIGVTGSNGKSTTVHALVEMCQSEEINGVLAGNVGFPFSDKVLEELQHPDSKLVYILEISSFQMEFIEQFHPQIAIFLNISPDHLDRHKTFANYLAAKLRLAENQNEHDFIIFNADDEILVDALKNHPAKKITFGRKYSDLNIYSVNNSNVINKEYAKLTERKNIGLPGQHNLYNLLAAASGAHCFGISDSKIADVMNTFKGIHHRLESIATIDGVEYINDSKATNIDAVKVAIESFEKPIILILGGIAKGNDFSELLQFKNKIKNIISYGTAKDMIYNELSAIYEVEKINLLKDAVKLSFQKAKNGDSVVLSPGCASFDQFINFEDRGFKFTQWVNNLGK